MDEAHTLIFSGEDHFVKVYHDESDPSWPIGFSVDQGDPGWIARDDVAKLVGVLTATVDMPPSDVNESLLRVAIENDLSVEFAYAKGDGTYIESRRLEPESIEVSKRDGKYVIGNDPDRDDIRAFRLDRIKGRVAVV